MNIYKQQPSILVFDSGIGGLSVYDEIRKKMPNLHYIYVLDNEMFPYGDKSNEFLIERVNHVIRVVAQTYPVSLAVIACNTASTICLPNLRSNFSFPIVGVVPAIKPASQVTQNKCIGLLATKATVKRPYIKNLIDEFAKDCRVELLGLSELALIAENKLQGIAVDMEMLSHLLKPWLTASTIPDTIVLGCTHYPFIKEELQALFPKTTFIDSGNAIALRVYNLLKQENDLNQISQSKKGNIILSTKYNEYIEKIMAKSPKYNFNKYQQVKFNGV